MTIPEREISVAEYRDKTLELFAVKGFGQVGMRELAACLGLSTGSFYHHYPSKQHLLFELIEEFYDELNDVLGRLLTKARGRKIKLEALIRVHTTIHRQMPFHFRLAERDVNWLTDEQRVQVSVLQQRYEAKLLTVLGLSGELSESAAHSTTSVIASLLNNAPRWLTNHKMGVREQEDLLHRLVSGAIAQTAMMS